MVKMKESLGDCLVVESEDGQLGGEEDESGESAKKDWLAIAMLDFEDCSWVG